MYLIKNITIVLFFLLANWANGQEIIEGETALDSILVPTDTVKTIEINDVEVIKTFEVKLGEAKRIGLGPKLQPTKRVDKTYNYDVSIIQADIEYPDPSIKPLAMKPDAKTNVNNFYAKLGYGNIKNPYADVSYSYNAPEVFNVTFDANVEGLDNTKKVTNQKYYKYLASLHTDFLIGENTLIGANVNGGYHQRRLHDINPIRSINFNRNVIDSDVELFIKNGEFEAFQYYASVGGDYFNISPLFNSENETELGINGRFSTSMRLGEHYALILDSKIAVDKLDLNVTNTSINLTTIQANPGFRLHWTGINLKTTADLIVINGEFTPFVSAELGINVNKGLQVYAGVEQEVSDNSLKATFKRIPYVLVSTNLLKNTLSKNFYAGIRGQLLDRIRFDFAASYQDISNLAHYINSSTYPTFSVNYVDAKNIKIDANLTFKLNEFTNIGAVINHSIYDIAEDGQIFNVPTFTYEAFARIGLFNNKLQLKTSLGLKDEILYRDRNLDVVSGNTMIDLSAELNFYVTENIAIWASGNNLLDNHYLQYTNYPTVGINALGGIIVKF